MDPDDRRTERRDVQVSFCATKIPTAVCASTGRCATITFLAPRMVKTRVYNMQVPLQSYRCNESRLLQALLYCRRLLQIDLYIHLEPLSPPPNTPWAALLSCHRSYQLLQCIATGKKHGF